MTYEQNKKLIEYLNAGKSCNQICECLGITNKQLYRRLVTLKNKGFYYERKYYSDGNISYSPINYIKGVKRERVSFEADIITRPNEDKLKVLIISDVHFGSKLERIDLLDRAYNYCINNNIHLILNCGDIIDGTFGRSDKRFSDTYKQIEHLIKHHPYDKNIINFGVGGDHDFSSLSNGFQDMIEMIKNNRHDLVIINYNNAFINIKNDKILLHHYLDKGKEADLPNNCFIILNGHVHKYIVESFNGNSPLNIMVPSLSDINPSLPSALELNLEFKNGFISNATIYQLHFGEKNYIMSESNFDLRNRPFISGLTNYNTYNYSFAMKENEINGSGKKRTLSQIDKFNNKYGIK